MNTSDLCDSFEAQVRVLDVALQFGGVNTLPGDWLCADADGVVLADAVLG